MKKSLFLMPLALVLSASLPSQAEPLPMKPGKYEVVSVVGSKTGVPGEPKKTTRCLRADEMQNPDYVFNARVIDAYKPDASCKAGEVVFADGKMTYTSDCKFEKIMVEGSASETAYTVTRTAKSKASGGVPLKSTLEGRRIGECR